MKEIKESLQSLIRMFNIFFFKRNMPKKISIYFHETGKKEIAEIISIINVEKGFKPGSELEVKIKYEDEKINKIKTLCRIDTQNELEYYKNGGILQYVLRNMI